MVRKIKENHRIEKKRNGTEPQIGKEPWGRQIFRRIPSIRIDRRPPITCISILANANLASHLCSLSVLVNLHFADRRVNIRRLLSLTNTINKESLYGTLQSCMAIKQSLFRLNK